MCGIFAHVIPNKIINDNDISNKFLKKLTSNLLKLSESRGKEASGVAKLDNGNIDILKYSNRATKLMKTEKYKKIVDWDENNEGYSCLIGHSRLVTNGNEDMEYNNQPIIKDKIIAVHNGIVVNDSELWELFGDKLERKYVVDTEILLSLIRYNLNTSKNIKKALNFAYNKIEGNASCVMIFEDMDIMVAATNNGSLYKMEIDYREKMVIFASERYILKKIANEMFEKKQFKFSIKQIKANNAVMVNLNNYDITEWNLNNDISVNQKYEVKSISRKLNIYNLDGPNEYKSTYINQSTTTINNRNDNRDLLFNKLDFMYEIIRCSKCILPESFPYIVFDSDGVCNYCLNYKNIEYKGEKEFERKIDQFRRNDERPELLVMFSGGRDSSYAVHYLKNILDMNIVTYTYDWGMITDLARRNVSRMCADLDVENILVSADVRKKRRNINLNLNAWLKKPELGMIPILMAGDKHWYKYANEVRDQLNVPQTILATNRLEETAFKTAFCDIKLLNNPDVQIRSKGNKTKLLSYYIKNYLKNIRYFNKSIFDNITGFYSFYMLPRNYLKIYDYIPWNESKIDHTLKTKYNWEKSSDTKTTWRIGDGTASFYNYVYLRLAGFSEIDTFRSNQIRQGLISREEAIKKAFEENYPRYESIKWYLNTIGLGNKFNNIIEIINNHPNLYE